MKIITWNCNGAFRKKYHTLDKYHADILIIQECENPNLSTKVYSEWSKDYFWIGKNKNKGLGVFAKNSMTIKLLDWSDKNHLWQNEILESFLPILINNKYILLAVWTKKANSETFGYIGQLWKYLKLHQDKLENKSVIIAGDFNSNTIWDRWDRWWNHSDVVKELEKINIVSLYHYFFKEKHGEETSSTFFMYKKIERNYHIDYIFISLDLLKKNKTSICIEKPKDWLEFSDHVPIISEV